jgi:hypothetical protein
MSSKQVEFLVKLRDAAAMMADAANEYLESLAPPEAKEEALDYSKLFWEKKQGEKGEYEQTSEKVNQNCDLWKKLKAKVKEHKGFWLNSGYKFWFHQQDESVIDRRKA